jgi:hypothetical protein
MPAVPHLNLPNFKHGYGRETIRHNIPLLMRDGYPHLQALAIAHSYARRAYWERHPHGFLPAWIYPGKNGRRDAPKDRSPRKNPATREDADAAARLAERFHGRPPEDEFVFEKPKFPDAMANIGPVFAIEYLAERDGKEYRFRHVFKQRSRPHLAVAPDGKFVALIGGSWRFTEDGFDDDAA